MKKYYINDLQERYNLKTRQSVYDRLKAIEIQVEKEGNKSYVTETVLEKLDQLQEHLNLGGSIKTFTPTVKTTVHSKIDNENFESPIDSINSVLDKANSSPDSVNSALDKANSFLDSNIQYVQLDLFETLMERVEEVVEKMIPINPISHWEKLDIAVERGYILSSQEVKNLVGTKPNGTKWTRGAFVFTRTGKIGNQAGWTISRL
ncbi:hypothetical protein GM3708_3579 (plasmid) [Geminocystis sp. NIES-3708]|uniref:hypothetical protein n=1 Tax=Geminocystis sp. NIES-3708 TaxID=1615909 RepID=UPI0005FCD021|nr:hypothetical protein [Geminocystis sp. NIES-3708]BAQ63173.1 hypothetical protein GM3708_3579 [Geminocystis sp. NIES-3708]